MGDLLVSNLRVSMLLATLLITGSWACGSNTEAPHFGSDVGLPVPILGSQPVDPGILGPVAPESDFTDLGRESVSGKAGFPVLKAGWLPKDLEPGYYATRDDLINYKIVNVSYGPPELDARVDSPWQFMNTGGVIIIQVFNAPEVKDPLPKAGSLTSPTPIDPIRGRQANAWTIPEILFPPSDKGQALHAVSWSEGSEGVKANYTVRGYYDHDTLWRIANSCERA